MSAIVKLVTIGSQTNYDNLTYREAADMPGSSHVLYSGKDHCNARNIEKYCQIEIANCERVDSSGFRFRLFQSTPGNGDAGGGPPFKVGIRFIRCNANWVPSDKYDRLMTSVVFRDDNRRIPHISMAIEAQPAVEEFTSSAKKA
jgi:hypothetical protein